MAIDAQAVLDLFKEENIKMVDLKFIDLPGTWEHFTLPANVLSEVNFIDGLGFDGSSIRRFQAINASNILVMPDPNTAIIDLACKAPTLSMGCNTHDPLGGAPYNRDPRFIVCKDEKHLKESETANAAYFVRPYPYEFYLNFDA